MRKHGVVGVLVSAVLILVVGGANVSAQGEAMQGNYASVNGVELYYEIHGEGEPLVLLHGGLGGIVEFTQLLPMLAETRQVIAVELQGHGHTADVDRPLSFETMADDVAALIEHLGHEQVDIMGFSLGGGVGLQTAIRHPDVVRKLVVISTVFKREGWYPAALEGMGMMNMEGAGEMMLQTPMYQFYSSVSPDVENWSTLVSKVGQLLATNYDWTADVPSITAPTLVVVGDSDMVQPSHALELVGLLGGGQMYDVMSGAPNTPKAQLAVLPGVTHLDILARTDLLMPIIVPFLDAPVPESA